MPHPQYTVQGSYPCTRAPYHGLRPQQTLRRGRSPRSKTPVQTLPWVSPQYVPLIRWAGLVCPSIVPSSWVSSPVHTFNSLSFSLGLNKTFVVQAALFSHRLHCFRTAALPRCTGRTIVARAAHCRDTGRTRFTRAARCLATGRACAWPCGGRCLRPLRRPAAPVITVGRRREASANMISSVEGGL